MVNLYLLTKHGPSHFPVSPLIFGLFEPFLDFLEKMDQKLVRFRKNTLCASVPSDSIAGSPSQTYIKC